MHVCAVPNYMADVVARPADGAQSGHKAAGRSQPGMAMGCPVQTGAGPVQFCQHSVITVGACLQEFADNLPRTTRVRPRHGGWDDSTPIDRGPDGAPLHRY